VTPYHRVLSALASRYEIDRFVKTHGPDPFRILVGCILSLRTKDDVAYAATARLFALARTPKAMLALSEREIATRKTANLTVTLGFGKPGICVDTHVHRIANRLGWVRTSSPEDTEAALRAGLPRRWWIPINETLVRHGQAVCKPISPICSACAVEPHCPKRGVGRRR